jgi:hypothetical protein
MNEAQRPDTPRDEPKPAPPARTTKHWVDYCVALMTLLALIWTVVFSTYQLNRANEASARSAQQVGKALDAAKASADAMQSLANVTRSAEEARLHLTSMHVDISNSGTIVLREAIENAGRSEADHFFPGLTVKLIPSLSGEIFTAYEASSRKCANTVWSGTDMELAAGKQIQIDNPEVVGDHAVQSLLEGQQILLVEGCLTYNTLQRRVQIPICFYSLRDMQGKGSNLPGQLLGECPAVVVNPPSDGG